MIDSEYHGCWVVIWVTFLRGAFDPYISAVIVFRIRHRCRFMNLYYKYTDVYIIQAKVAFSLTFMLRAVF